MTDEKSRNKKIDDLLSKAEKLKTQNLKEGIKAARQALDLARGSRPEEQMLPEKLSDSLFMLGVLQGEAFEQDAALTALFEALSIFSQLGNDHKQAATLMAISQVYFRCHDEDLALEYAARALRGFETLRSRENEAEALYAMGSMYFKTGFLSLAMNHFNKAISIARELGKDCIEADALEEMSQISLQQKEYYPALGHSLKSLEIRQQTGDLHAQARVLMLMGRVHQEINAIEDAHDCFLQSLQYARETKNPALEAKANLWLGKHHLAQGEQETAVEHLRQALELAETAEMDALYDPDLLEIHRSLAGALQGAGSLEEALAHYQLAFAIEKKRMEMDFQSRLKGQQVSHRMETARKEAEIYELRNVELRQEVEERQQIQAELEKTVIHDSLTRVFNRRHWLELAQREIDRSTRYQQPLSVILLDIERLRSINDEFGREAGAHALQFLANQCKKNLRKPDSLARLGEDEFIILLPQTDIKGAKLLAERLREDIETGHFEHNGQAISIQVSLGTAGFEQGENATLESFIDQATHALYQEKTARRDLKSG